MCEEAREGEASDGSTVEGACLEKEQRRDGRWAQREREREVPTHDDTKPEEESFRSLSCTGGPG